MIALQLTDDPQLEEIEETLDKIGEDEKAAKRLKIAAEDTIAGETPHLISVLDTSLTLSSDQSSRLA